MHSFISLKHTSDLDSYWLCVFISILTKVQFYQCVCFIIRNENETKYQLLKFKRIYAPDLVNK